MRNDDLTDELVQTAHEYYLETNSLKATAKWLKMEHDVAVNRHNLSAAFHKHSLYVSPPNGRGLEYQGMRTWGSDLNKLLVDYVTALWKDVLNYLNNSTGSLEFITACYAIHQDLYGSILMRLNRSGSSMFTANTLPPGVTREDLLHGLAWYSKLLDRWVFDGIERFK